MVGHGRVADRAHQHGVVRAQGVERVRRHHPAVLVPVGGAPRAAPSTRSGGPSASTARRASAITSGPTPSPGRRATRWVTAARADAASRHALHVLERVLDRDDVGVLRLDVEQVRLVRRLRPVGRRTRAGRSSASRTGAGRPPSPGCSRSSSRRRGSPSRRPARPGSRRGSSRRTPDAPFFSTIVSSVPRLEPRVDLDPAPADLEVAERAAPSAARGRRPSGSARSRSS